MPSEASVGPMWHHGATRSALVAFATEPAGVRAAPSVSTLYRGLDVAPPQRIIARLVQTAVRGAHSVSAAAGQR